MSRAEPVPSPFPPTLHTSRLVLRPLTSHDTSDVFAYASDAEATVLSRWRTHRTIADSQRFVARSIRAYGRGYLGPWGIELTCEACLFGTCGFTTWDAPHRRAEIGYSLARRCWGRGYMTEALRRVIEWGFSSAALNRIAVKILCANERSLAVARRLDMTPEGVLRQYRRLRGVSHDVAVFSLVADQWRARETSLDRIAKTTSSS
jgi:[ribosomal protein S5]-alanine N-acetyltransferase